jgi:hypothetical protein
MMRVMDIHSIGDSKVVADLGKSDRCAATKKQISSAVCTGSGRILPTG